MNENEAQKTITQLDRELENFDRAYEEGRWLKNQGLLSAAHQSDLEGRRAHILLDPGIWDIVSEFIDTTTDPVFRRLLFVLDRLIKAARAESNPSVYEIRSRIEQAIGSYPITLAGKKVTRTEVRQVLRSEQDAKLRHEAMHCYDELSRMVEKDLKELILQRNSIAREMGYEHFGELGLAAQGLSRSELHGWFEAILQSTEGIYKTFLSESAAKLGQPRLYPYDLSYAVSQFNTLPDRYFLKKKLADSIFWLGDRIGISEALRRVRIDYVDIPFQGICVTIHVPDDIRILINPMDGHTYTVTYFHEVGHAMHSSYITQPYHLFRDETGPACEGMAQTMARFVDDPEWLIHFAGVPEPLVDQFKPIWRTYNIYHMRALITQAEFEWQMYAEPEKNQLDCLRSLQEEVLKVPAGDTLAWADNIYWASYPFYVQNYVVAEMIASQNHHALRNKFGKAIHPDAGAWWAENYWNPGGSIEWTDKIRTATGAPLSTDQLIRELQRGYPAD